MFQNVFTAGAGCAERCAAEPAAGVALALPQQHAAAGRVGKAAAKTSFHLPNLLLSAPILAK
jgi:hypothetical protein